MDQPKWPLSHMCTCVISSLSNATVMSLSTNSPAETCDTLLLLVISVCCHFIYNLFVLQAYKIESSRRSLTAILGDPVGFTKMTSYSLLLYLLQDYTNKYNRTQTEANMHAKLCMVRAVACCVKSRRADTSKARYLKTMIR